MSSTLKLINISLSGYTEIVQKQITSVTIASSLPQKTSVDQTVSQMTKTTNLN